MDIIWNSLILIFIGWFLSEFTRFLIGRRENKQKINRAIFPVLNLKLSLENSYPILKAIEEKESLDSLDLEILKSVWEDDSVTGDSFLIRFDNSITEVSSLDPMLALGLSLLYSTSKSIMNKEFIINNIEKNFKRMIGLQLKAIAVFVKRLEGIIRKLLFRHSKILFIRYLLYERKNRKSKELDWDKLFSY